jgi:hypothetical protein
MIFENKIVNFLSSNRSETGTVEAVVGISYLPLGKDLDTNDLKVKTKTAHDYVTDSINYMNSGESTKPGALGFQWFLKPVKNTSTTVGTNHIPAWRLEYTSRSNLGDEKTSYIISIFAVSGDKVFIFDLDGVDPLQIPNYLPIFQKMIDSFQLLDNR